MVYSMAKTMAKMKCPHCDKPIGSKDNPFNYDTVSYYDEVKGKEKLVLEYVVIFCTSCGAVLGVTR